MSTTRINGINYETNSVETEFLRHLGPQERNHCLRGVLFFIDQNDYEVPPEIIKVKKNLFAHTWCKVKDELVCVVPFIYLMFIIFDLCKICDSFYYYTSIKPMNLEISCELIVRFTNKINPNDPLVLDIQSKINTVIYGLNSDIDEIALSKSELILIISNGSTNQHELVLKEFSLQPQLKISVSDNECQGCFLRDQISGLWIKNYMNGIHDEKMEHKKFKYFISHSGTNKPLALKIKGSLNNCFVDQTDIELGITNEQALMNAIIHSTIIIFLVSKVFLTSKWCLWELGEAIKLGKIIIPVFLDVDIKEAPQFKPYSGIEFRKIDEDVTKLCNQILQHSN